MKFWDSSAIAPLLVEETTTSSMRALYVSDSVILAWWGTRVECVSAVARLERERRLSDTGVAAALAHLNALAVSWNEIQPGEEIRETAARLLRVHNLRASDAFQLAAAFLASERRPPSLEIVSLDDRLSAAAEREGFVLVPVSRR